MSEKSQYTALLTHLGDDPGVYSGKLVAATAKRGVLATGELMVIGRSLNGWPGPFSLAQLGSPAGVSRVVDSIFRIRRFERKCPVAWVARDWGSTTADYNPARSAFWRVARRIQSELCLNGSNTQEWSSHLMWSNLYKISPYPTGNPTNRLCAAQLSYCRRIILQEFKALRPKRVVLLTGLDWAHDFITSPHFTRHPDLEVSPMEWVGHLSSQQLRLPVPVVIGPHPQGKPEGPIVESAVAALTAMLAGQTGLTISEEAQRAATPIPTSQNRSYE